MTQEALPNKFRKLFFGLFVFPLVIAIGMAVLLCSVVLLTHEQETADTLVLSIKTGSPAKRWQKAFELSNELNRNKKGVRPESTMNEIIAILGDANRYDTKTRGYMAIALSHFNHPHAIAALQKSLKDESEDVRIYSVWGLGVLQARESAPAIMPFLQNDSAELRKIAAYALGVLGDDAAIPALKNLLRDSSVDVSWNAALSLARLGDPSGKEILFSMLNRATYSNFSMNEADVEKTMINATKGLALIKEASAQEILKKISRTEKSLKVRQAAMDAMQYSGQPLSA